MRYNKLINADLYSYIDSLCKDPGDYSKDELYEIGLRHRRLPRSERNWEKLCNYIGYTGKPESFRKFVAKRCNMTLEMLDIIDDPENFQTVYKEKTQIRDIYNAYRSTLRKESRVDSFIENLCEAVKAVQPYKIDNVKKYPQNCTEGVLLISDMHIGVNCHNFYNTYNKQVAEQRLNKLADDVIHYCEHFKVSTLNVLNLGDLIHGIIHVNARIEQELDLIDQIITASELLANFLIKLDNSKINIVYRSCTDNHSRAISDKAVSIEEENFSKLIDLYVTLRLQNSKSNVIFKHDNIDESLGKFNLQNGKKLMFAHGHLENVNKCFDNFVGATKEFIDYICLAHFHTGKEKGYNGSKVIINGSIVGTEQFACGKRLFSPAEQKLLIFDRDNFLDLTINLQ